MKTPTLPVLAAWLLAQADTGHNRDALAGDLTESLVGGRSRWWLWREVLVAVAVKLLADLRTIPLRAAASVASGWILACVLMYGGMIAWGGLRINMSQLHLYWNGNRPHYVVKCYVTLFFASVVATAIVSMFDRKRRLALLLTWISFQILWGCGWMIYFFQDPVRWYATVQLEGFFIALLGDLVGALLSLNSTHSSALETTASSN